MDLLPNYFWWLVAWYMDGAAESEHVGRGEERVSAAGGICSGDLWPPQSTVQRLPWELLCLVRGDWRSCRNWAVGFSSVSSSS